MLFKMLVHSYNQLLDVPSNLWEMFGPPKQLGSGDVNFTPCLFQGVFAPD